MQRLRKIMAAKGISQTQLSRLTGISQGAISMILNNKRSPKWENIIAIANALDVSTEDLRDDIEHDDQEEEEHCAEVEQMCLCA